MSPDTILEIGVDIIENARFRPHENAHFLNRCFTEDEQAYLAGRPTASMAGLFAAKEAVVKALGTGFRGFWPCEVEIRHDEWGKPYPRLHGEAARLAKKKRVVRITVSITHHQTSALSVAVAERMKPHARRYRRGHAPFRSTRH